MILFLHGPDTFRSRQNLQNSIAQFKLKRDPHGYNVVFVDGKKESAGKIFTEISAAPFLGEKRMIVIENVLSSGDKELLGELVERAAKKKFPDSNIVIFWQGEALSKVKEAKELFDLLKKEKYAQEFSPFKGVELTKWAEKELAARGGKIEHQALEFLCQNAGGDMWQLNSLIDQLAAYAPGRPIALPDIQLFLDEKVDDNVFNMVEAIVGGNHKLAFKLLEEQRRLGEEDGKIFGLIVWQFRILLEMGDALEREPNLTSDSLAKKLKIHPFVAKKNLATARRLSTRAQGGPDLSTSARGHSERSRTREHGRMGRCSLSELQAIYQSLLEIDIKTKTGAAPQDLLVDVFISESGN